MMKDLAALQQEVNILMMLTLFIGLPMLIALILISKTLYRMHKKIDEQQEKLRIVEEKLIHEEK